MRSIIGCGISVLLISVSHAWGVAVSLNGPTNGSTVLLPLDGGTYDVGVYFTRNPEDPGFLGFQFDVKADTAGFATLNGRIGGSSSYAGNTTTGTRYNDPEWDANISTGFAFNPNIAAGPLSPTARGPIASAYLLNFNPELNLGVWNTASTLFGYLNITMAPGEMGQTVVVELVNVIGVDDTESWEDVPIPGYVNFQYVPEPASVLLIGTGIVLASSRKRRSPR